MKVNTVVKTTIVTGAICVAMSIASYAGGLESSQLVVGTRNLLQDGTTVLTGLVGAITAFIAIKNAIAWNTAGDQDKPVAQKKFVKDLGIGVIGTVIVGLVSIILGYYGG